MRRERFLWPLTHGHQHGLSAAKIIRERWERNPLDPALAGEIRAFFEADLEPHFQAEEELLAALGGLWGEGDPVVLRILEDHRRLRDLAFSTDPGDAAPFAALLAEHIPYEEGTLFPRVERDLPVGEREKWGRRFEASASACPRLPGRPKG